VEHLLQPPRPQIEPAPDLLRQERFPLFGGSLPQLARRNDRREDPFRGDVRADRVMPASNRSTASVRDNAAYSAISRGFAPKPVR
jgi:hypothetical protein